MTSTERREMRYHRRVAQRQAKKQTRNAMHDCFDQVFSYDNLYQSYQKCRRNVAWKASVQRYITQAPLLLKQTHDKLQAGAFKSSGFYEFDLYERGKRRHIRSVTTHERVVQRCLCDNALVPVLGRTFIYDNGASLERKGYTFAANRVTKHLRDHYRRYGDSGYVLIFDFSKFFDRVSHRLVKEILEREFSDDRIKAITEQFIDDFGDVGMGLGSQISQVLALASANRLDHFIKEKCGIRGYVRYMDDGILIHHSKKHLQHCLDAIRTVCAKLEITLNEKKTQIVKISHGFTFIKIRFYLLPSGRIIKKMNHRSVTKMRQKLKVFREKVDAGIMRYSDVYQSWQSWRAYASNFNAYHTIQSMAALYNELFIFTSP